MSQTHIFKLPDMTAQEMRGLANALERGAVAVIPTDTVYGLATGAYCENGIQRIYQIKNRPTTSPLQILAGSLAQAQKVAQFSSGAARLAHRFWPGGLTLILPPTAQGQTLARGFEGLGLRVPGNSFLQKLLNQMVDVLACTSANLHGQAVVTKEEILLNTFNGEVDYIVLAGTLSPVASSVVDLTNKPRLLREAALSRVELEETLKERLN